MTNLRSVAQLVALPQPHGTATPNTLEPTRVRTPPSVPGDERANRAATAFVCAAGWRRGRSVLTRPRRDMWFTATICAYTRFAPNSALLISSVANTRPNTGAHHPPPAGQPCHPLVATGRALVPT